MLRLTLNFENLTIHLNICIIINPRSHRLAQLTSYRLQTVLLTLSHYLAMLFLHFLRPEVRAGEGCIQACSHVIEFKMTEHVGRRWWITLCLLDEGGGTRDVCWTRWWIT